MRRKRVLANVENKRIGPGIFLKYLGAVLLFLFLLPYVITSIFSNVGSEEVSGPQMPEIIGNDGQLTGAVTVINITAAGSERIPLEIYLVDQLARVISPDYAPAALKAQAILLRTALIEQLWHDTGTIRGSVALSDDDYGYGRSDDIFAEAVYATQGVFLTYGDIPAKAPYFAVSNGKTRNGAEVLADGTYPYLPSVRCNRDFMAANYTANQTVSKNEFTQAWENAAGEPLATELMLDGMIIERDTNDYIVRITLQGQSLSGEECRAIWGLDSACFYMKEKDNKINFTVKGVGHGLGMSQFAANEMAIAESDYIEILEYFFPQTQLTKFE